jgi:hypothetical protein
MSIWTAVWIAWLAVFVVVEGWALARKAPGDTLSEQVWHWLHVTPGQTPSRAVLLSWRSFALAGLLLWLVGHFLLGWWT